MKVAWIDGRSTKSTTKQVTFDSWPVADFMERHFPALNELTDWLGMSIEENKRITFAVAKCVGFDIPEEIDEA